MALPTVAINGSTGSDTAASGAGPATALSGSLAATHTTATVNITDAVNLAGVAVDGSAVLWVATSSGRRWSAITAISGSSGAWVVTVGTAYATTQSGASWAIGGQRASLDGSTQLGLDMRAGWIIDVQTAQTIAANFRVTPNAASGLIAAFTSTATIRPTITTSTNSVAGLDIGGANNLQVSHLIFRCTAATPGDGILQVAIAGTQNITISDCVIDGFRTGIEDIDAGNNVQVAGLILERVEVKNCTRSGIVSQTVNSSLKMDNCYVHNNNTSAGAFGGLTCAAGNLAARGCIFDANRGYNASLTLINSRPSAFLNCDFTGALSATANGDGLLLSGNGGATLLLKGNIFWGNARYGVAGPGAALTDLDGLVNLANAYGGNGTAARQNIPAGAGDVTLTASPFVSSADFAPNATAGGGALLRGAATAPLGTATATATADIGAIQSVPTAAPAGPTYFAY